MTSYPLQPHLTGTGNSEQHASVSGYAQGGTELLSHDPLRQGAQRNAAGDRRDRRGDRRRRRGAGMNAPAPTRLTMVANSLTPNALIVDYQRHRLSAHIEKAARTAPRSPR